MANPTAKVYLNQENPGALLVPTFVGSLDSAGGISITVYGNSSDHLIVVFEGGTAGDIAHVSLYGQEIIHRGPR